MPSRYTDAQFDELSWHDCHIWGLKFLNGDPPEDWIADLVLDIDYITDWLCGVDRRVTFQVAPATLAFHCVSEFQISIGQFQESHHCGFSQPTINWIERSLMPWADPPGRPHHRWKIGLHPPPGGDQSRPGEITFCASGFTLTLLAEAVPSEGQALTRLGRDRLIGRSR